MARLGPLVRHVSRWVVLVAVTGASIVLAAWLILQWGILPRVDRWKPHIEARASQALGVTVRIERIDVAGSLWAPMLTLQRVQLANAAGHEQLQLRQVRAVLVPSSLLPRSLTHWEPSFEQLWIDAPSLQVQRHRDGRWSVAGIDIGRPGTGDDGQAVDWLLQQRELAVRGGTLTWTDEQAGTAPLALTDVTLVLRNTFTQHRWRIDATPPAAVGQPVQLLGDFRQSLLAAAGLQRPGDWRRWRGQLYLRAPLLDTAALARHVALPAWLGRGRLALQGWVDADDGELTGVSAQLSGRDVALPAQDAVPALALRTLAARVDVSRRPAGAFRRNEQVRLDVSGLRFDTADGLRWADTSAGVEWERGADGTLRSGSAEASALDLAALARLGAQARLPAPWRRLLDETQPRGRLLQARARWQGSPLAPTSYWAAGRAEQVGLDGAAPPPQLDRHTLPRRPGVRQADIDFEFTERGGRARLGINDGAIELPGVFEDPLVPFTRLSGELRWRIDTAAPGPRRAAGAPHLQVEWHDVEFANADLRGQAQGRWNTGERRLPGHLELDAQIDAAAAARVHRYLPLALPESTRHYLRDALRSGRVEDLTARVRGPLLAFPYSQPGSGEFTLAARVAQADFAYVPDAAHPWPAFSGVEVEVEIDRQSLRLRRGQALLQGLGSGPFALGEIEGRIDDLAHQPHLRIEGRGRGPADAALQYLRDSPVGALLDHALQPATAGGPIDLGLALDIPLTDASHTQVSGQVLLPGNPVQLRPDVPLLADARARVDFTGHGFSVTAASARVLGGTLAFEGGQRDGAIRFTGQGTASAEGLRRAAEWPALARLGTQLSGQARYQLELTFPRGHAEVHVTSTLAGMGARLPAPLGKAEAAELPLRFSLQPVVASAAPAASATGAAAPREPLREWLRVEVGTVLGAQYLLETPAAGGPARVLRGQVGLGAPADLAAAAPPASAGTPAVSATVALPQLSVDDWRDWWEHNAAVLGAGTGAAAVAAAPGASGVPATAAVAAAVTAAEEAARYVPGLIRLRSAAVQVGGQRLNSVDAVLAQDAGAWRIDLSADQLAGRIDVRPGATPAAPRAVSARLSRLAIPKDDGPAGPAAAAPARRPDPTTSLPDVDLEVDAFEWRGRPLGRLVLRAANRGDGSPERPREWRVAQLALTSPEARLTASGNWTPQRTALAFQLDLHDTGAWFERLGWAGTLRRGSGQVRGDLAWRGSPLAFDLASLSGHAHIGVDRGQFLRAEPGAARLLGVLSLQSLARRLTLDFNDVFGDGFAFDRMDGDVSLAEGVARTTNLRIRGVQAAILTEGSTDLARASQDLHIWVVPDVNAGAASLLYAAINPAIGIGTLIGQLFLRKTIAEATTREFRVTGTWDAPVVAQVSGPERRPAPAAGDEASAPAAGASQTPQAPAAPQLPPQAQADPPAPPASATP